MNRKDDQSADSVFGQTPAFSLTDPGVDPAVIEYLSCVRQEALRTNVIKRSELKRHTADIYDDDDEVIVKKPKAHKDLPVRLKYVDSHLLVGVQWFETVKRAVLDSRTVYQNHTEESLNLLLHFLREYLSGKLEGDGQASHILDVLQELPPKVGDGNDDYELDEEWAESVVKKLRTKHINSITDIKAVIGEVNSSKPIGFKQWYQYLQRTEPTQSAFNATIDGRNIWVLVQYMAQEWIKNISKGKKPAQASRFSNWLLYILFNIPDKLTAEYISNLRSLGKKCRRAIRESQEGRGTQSLDRKTPSIKAICPRELTELDVPSPPEDLDVVQLALSVIAVIYGQRDLIEWAIEDDQL
ncbi:hypothetical protein HG536_0B02320 [Torulaspora globosa]|uniref:Pre-mRNA-splicing factor BRR1 n=1 Tax=Torulaspora globosa TaxID=48254 RepID=A0A7G3ZCY3_9SACH|nr:uncharacterized protein HG536_0B02320 [Torulaspora globosa]QLL31369.1 hypothetical protein HG536_0B02320 [Torulaspora globosa]